MSDINKIMQEISEKIEGAGELVEKGTDSELVKVTGNIFKFVDTAVKINKYVIQKRFESCLKGSSEEIPTEKQLERVKKFINSPERADVNNHSIDERFVFNVIGLELINILKRIDK